MIRRCWVDWLVVQIPVTGHHNSTVLYSIILYYTVHAIQYMLNSIILYSIHK